MDLTNKMYQKCANVSRIALQHAIKLDKLFEIQASTLVLA